MKTNFNPTTYQGSTKGGSIALTGHGLPDGWPSQLFSIQVKSGTKSLDVNVISATPDRLELKVPAGEDGKAYSIKLTNPN